MTVEAAIGELRTEVKAIHEKIDILISHHKEKIEDAVSDIEVIQADIVDLKKFRDENIGENKTKSGFGQWVLMLGSGGFGAFVQHLLSYASGTTPPHH